MTLLIIGEHPTLNEAGAPFTNGLWGYFKAKLSQIGINPRDAIFLNVFNQPSGNMFTFLQKGKVGALSALPAITKGWYIKPEYGSDISALYSAIRRIKPNLILSVGDIPLAVLAHQGALKYARGRITSACAAAGELKMLPVLHPRAVQADIAQEPILLADLMKARREMQFPEIKRPQRFLHLHPSLEDLEIFWQDFIIPSSALSIDIETKGAMITCVGVAPSPERSLVVPFYSAEQKDGNYWRTKREEKIAWDFIRRCCSTPGKAVFGQNFSYDAQYLWRQMGIPVPTWTDDTMIIHHALQPEMEKGLGFLASIYSDELAWKFMVKRRAADRSGKKED